MWFRYLRRRFFWSLPYINLSPTRSQSRRDTLSLWIFTSWLRAKARLGLGSCQSGKVRAPLSPNSMALTKSFFFFHPKRTYYHLFSSISFQREIRAARFFSSFFSAIDIQYSFKINNAASYIPYLIQVKKCKCK